MSKFSLKGKSAIITGGGSGIGNARQITSKKQLWNGRSHAAEITLPPLGIVIFELK